MQAIIKIFSILINKKNFYSIKYAINFFSSLLIPKVVQKNVDKKQTKID